MASSGSAGRESDEECARRLQREYDEEVRRKEAKERFDCPVCLETQRLDEGVELDCLHRVCRDCLAAYLECRIREKRVRDEELQCPMPRCDQMVTVPQIEGALGGRGPLWDRFLASRVELWRPREGCAERLVECPGPSCAAVGFRFVVGSGAEEVTCPRCRIAFCALCGRRHAAGTGSCARDAERRRVAEVDEGLEELIRRERLQRCPRCGCVCERQHGCNYMTCHSPRCRGATSFCYLCGCELSTVQHVTHFPHGLFANACTAVDLRDDPALPTPAWGTPDWWSAVFRDAARGVRALAVGEPGGGGGGDGL